MNQSEESLRELLEQSIGLRGETRISLREDLLRHAEAGGHTRLAFDIRLELVQNYALLMLFGIFVFVSVYLFVR